MNKRIFGLVFILVFFFGNFSINTVWAEIVDTTPPTISLLGSSPISLSIGEVYIDAGATALDDDNTDLTSSIVVVNPVDINTAGTYTVSYNVTDLAENMAAEITRIVNITEILGDSDTNNQNINSEPTPTSLIHLNIETTTESIFNNDVTVSACTTLNNTTPTLNGFCAFNNADIAVDATWYSFGALINSINNISASDSFWLWFLNGDVAQVGIDSYILEGGDTILWTLGVQPLKVTVSTETPTVGEPVIITVNGFNTDIFEFVPVADARLDGLSVVTDENGVATITATSTDPINFTVSAEGFITSENIKIEPVSPPLPTENIILKIYSGNNILFNGPLTVTACAESPEIDAPVTINAKCAIEQSELSYTWVWYDSNFHTVSDLPKTLGILEELGGNSSDITNYIYWGWFSDLNYGTVALNKHLLRLGEELLLTYNSYPLRISASQNSGIIGDTIIFTAEEKSSFSADFSDMIWTPSSEAIITLGTQSCTTTIDGTCSIILDTIGSINATGNKTLYIPSANITIIVSAAQGGGGGGGGSISTPVFSVPNALAYLKNAQKEDGSFENSLLYTDWAAIAYGALDVTDNSRDSLLEYLNSHNSISSLTTDNERRTMALLALGQNPYSFNGVNYIDAITKDFDGAQFGDMNLINDDIFALIPLASAGYTANDDIIIKDIAFIISKQKTNGSWEESVDITAAAVQALKPFDSIAGAFLALENAEIYLTTLQGDDGGWGNIFSTSWAMQAENTLDAEWTKNGKSGIDYLAEQQISVNNNGALLPSSDTTQNIIWATSYAIPAGLGKPWKEIMESVSKPANQNHSNNASSAQEEINTSDNTEISDTILPNNETNLVIVDTPPAKKTITLIPETKKSTVISKNDSPIITDTQEITSDVLAATAINALSSSNSNIPQNFPVLLGLSSGIILLFAIVKLFII
ncbi:MAG: immunoglobulin-like domain-containing protein [Candidatus Paceibacterota bacterium]